MGRRKQDDPNEQDHDDDNERIDNSEPDDGNGILDGFGNIFPKDLTVNFLSDIVRKVVKEDASDVPMDILNKKDTFTGQKTNKGSKIAIDAVFAVDEGEQFPGTTRNYLTVQGQTHTFGTSLCKWLTDELKKHYDLLLFGLIDNIYLHYGISLSFVKGNIYVGIKIFWDERESPHRLLIPNAADIMKNPELVYLIVGDLVGDLLNQIEDKGRKERRRWLKR